MERGRYSPDVARSVVLRASERSGLRIDPDARVEALSVESQQRVEILKAVARNASLLILDEPNAVLTPAEARELLGRMRRWVEDGATAILITHKLRDALEFADEMTVLRQGRTVWTGPANDADEGRLVSAMIGGELATGLHRREKPPASTHERESVIELADVSVRDERGIERLTNASLSVYGGEILGVAAVEGNGQRELLRVLAGRVQPTSGAARGAVAVGFVPEDRYRDAIVPSFSLVENVMLSGASAHRGVIRWSDERRSTDSLLQSYDVRADGPDVAIESLSGGNQQKLVVGREIERSMSALVAENPSRGLDVKATAAVHDRLRVARDRGMAVVIYSSDLDEVLALSDRVVVVHSGRVSEVPLDRDFIGRAMLGAEV